MEHGKYFGDVARMCVYLYSGFGEGFFFGAHLLAV